MRKKIIIKFYLIIFSILIRPIYGDSVITNATEDSILSLIESNYSIYETNFIYHDINKLLIDDLTKLLRNYKTFSQADLDETAVMVFSNFYHNVNLGYLADSNDYRRQCMRAAIGYSSIGLCSENNFSYYLDLALHSITEEGRPIEFLEDFYLSQLLVNLYIYHVKKAEYGVHKTIASCKDFVKDIEEPSLFYQSVQTLITSIENYSK